MKELLAGQNGESRGETGGGIQDLLFVVVRHEMLP